MFVSDVKCSNKLFIDTYGIDKLFLIGNCGGAITALLSSKDFPKSDGLILLDLPVTVNGEDKGCLMRKIFMLAALMQIMHFGDISRI